MHSAKPRHEQSLVASASSVGIHQAASELLDFLWHIAESRADMPNLPSALAQSQGQLISALTSGHLPKASSIIHNLIVNTVLPFAEPKDAVQVRTSLSHLTFLSLKTDAVAFFT
jgi:hypothetical protein